MSDEEKEYYTIPEVGVVLGINYLQARRLVQIGRIKSIDLEAKRKSQKNKRVLKEDLLDYINKTVKVKK